MDALLERCSGIGKNEVVALRADAGPGGKGWAKQTRTFLSFTGDVEAMAGWFAAEGVTDVVMEATGSYWKPVWRDPEVLAELSKRRLRRKIPSSAGRFRAGSGTTTRC